MISPTDTHPDAAFEDEVRAMLARRADDVAPADLELDLPDGLRIDIDGDPARPSRRGRVLALVAAVVLVLGLLAVVVGRIDDGTATDIAGEGGSATSAPAVPAASPHIAGLPDGVVAEDLLPFWDDADAPRASDPAGAVAGDYLEDRIVDRSRGANGIAWAPAVIDGGWAEVTWAVADGAPLGPGPEPDGEDDGTVHLRLIDGRWQVVAAISRTISLAGLSHDGTDVAGSVSNTDGAPLEVAVSTLGGEEVATYGYGTDPDSASAGAAPRIGEVDPLEVGDQPVLVRVSSGDRPGVVGVDGVGVGGLAEIVLAPPSATPEPAATTPPSTTAPPTPPDVQPGVGEAGSVTTVAPVAPPLGVGGVPAPEGLPGGTDLATVPALLTGAEGDDARDVGLAYLDDRFQRVLGGPPLGLSEPAPGPDAERWAVVRWELLSDLEDLPSGFVVLRRDGAAWSVVASTTDGVDLADLRRDGDRVTGLVATDGTNLVSGDVTDPAGTPVPDSPLPGLPEDGLLPGQRPIGTAGQSRGALTVDVPVPTDAVAVIQARQVGGGILSISEVALV